MVSQHEDFALPLGQRTTQLLEPGPQFRAAEQVFGFRVRRPQRQPADESVPSPAIDDDPSGDKEEPGKGLALRPATFRPGGLGSPEGFGRRLLGFVGAMGEGQAIPEDWAPAGD